MSLLLQTIPAALLATLSPVSAVIMLFVIIPTYLLKDTFAGQPVNFLEMATVMVALGLTIRFAWLPEFRAQVIERLRWLRQQKSIVLAVLVFLLAAIVAVIFSADLYRSLGVLKGWYILPMLGGLMAYLVFRRPGDVYGAITGLSVAAGLVSWYGLIDFYRIHDPWKYVGMRLDSFYTSPNYLALYIGPIIVLGLNLLLFVPAIRKHRITLWLLSGSLVLNTLALILSMSFGGFFGVFAGLAFLLLANLFKGRVNKKFMAGVLMVFVAIAIGLFITSINSAKFQRDFYDRDGVSSLRGRIEVWSVAREIIVHHPVVGMGLGNYDVGYIEYVDEAISWQPIEKVMIHAHNIFLDFLTDSGIIGLLSFLLLLAIIFRAFIKAGEKRGVLTYGSIAALVTILAHGLVDTPYFKNDLAYVFWFIIFVFIYSLFQSSESE